MALREVQELEPNRFQTGVFTLLTRAIAQQSLVWVALLGAIAAWGFVLVRPDWIRVAAASLYTVSVLLPLIYRPGGR